MRATETEMDPTVLSTTAYSTMRELNSSVSGFEKDEDNAATMVSKIAILAFWITVALCNGYLVWVTYRDHTRRQTDDEAEADDDDTTNVHLIAKKLAGMPLHAKLAYYNKLFDKQGNQLELTKEQIIVVTGATDGTETATRTTTTKTLASWEDGNEDLEKGTSPRDSITPPSPNQRQEAEGTGVSDWFSTAEEEPETVPLMIYLSPSTVHPCGEPHACASRNRSTSPGENNNDHDNNNTNNNTNDHTTTTTTRNIDGQCVICLEMFRAGETIVYNSNTCPKLKQDRNRTLPRGDDGSNNTHRSLPLETTTPGSFRGGCSHVYHKTCLVQYLSNRIISPQGVRDGAADTPSCPTCREPYVELLSILSVVNDNDSEKDNNVNVNGDCHNGESDGETLSVTHRIEDSEDSDSSSSGQDFEV